MNFAFIKVLTSETRFGGTSKEPIKLNLNHLSNSSDNGFYTDLVVHPLGKREATSTSPSHFFVEEVDKTLTSSTNQSPQPTQNLCVYSEFLDGSN